MTPTFFNRSGPGNLGNLISGWQRHRRLVPVRRQPRQYLGQPLCRGHRLGAAQLIETDTGGASAPQVAFDANGNAMAVWQQSGGNRVGIRTNRYVAGTGWGAAQLIETDNAGSANHSQIALDNNGNAIAVWYQDDGTRGNIWANRYVAGTGWGTAQLIETDNAGAAYYPQIAFDNNGNAIAVWQQSDGTRNNIQANRYALYDWTYSTTSGQIAWDADSTGRTRALVIETATRVVTDGSTTSNITYVDNLVETGFFLGERTRYFHTDHLGSLTAITDGMGNVVERMSYDAWGKRRNPNGSDDTASALRGANTKHGYTLHEHLDGVGLVHMNGRIYDPLIGRFLSADPNIFYPENLQDFNRYSYVHNNPLSLTDPSGFVLYVDGIYDTDPMDFALGNAIYQSQITDWNNAFNFSLDNLYSFDLSNASTGVFSPFGANYGTTGMSETISLSSMLWGATNVGENYFGSQYRDPAYLLGSNTAGCSPNCLDAWGTLVGWGELASEGASAFSGAASMGLLDDLARGSSTVLRATDQLALSFNLDVAEVWLGRAATGLGYLGGLIEYAQAGVAFDEGRLWDSATSASLGTSSLIITGAGAAIASGAVTTTLLANPFTLFGLGVGAFAAPYTAPYVTPYTTPLLCSALGGC